VEVEGLVVLSVTQVAAAEAPLVLVEMVKMVELAIRSALQAEEEAEAEEEVRLQLPVVQQPVLLEREADKGLREQVTAVAEEVRAVVQFVGVRV